jgi:hypothetical protein
MAFMALEHIETEASKLIHAYSSAVTPIATPPIPVEEIFECHLGFDLIFADLRAKYGDDNVLAEIYILSKQVIVDQSLDPEVYPHSEGRYRFTLGHEIGHWVLHGNDVIAVANIPDLFGDAPPPVICRDYSSEPHEWQANQFAAHLLMPDDFVRDEWNKIHPQGPLNVYDEIRDKQRRYQYDDNGQEPICDIVRKLAPLFKVSLRAMQIRLKALRLLNCNKPEQLLL